jgi:hypothetical protein
MSSSDSPKIRRDGWTRERRFRFLDTLWRTGSVSAAAASAGMSRESAYRLRRRKSGAGSPPTGIARWKVTDESSAHRAARLQLRNFSRKSAEGHGRKIFDFTVKRVSFDAPQPIVQKL